MHRVAGKKLNRNTKQRRALFKNLANSVILYEKVETTEAKAKAVKPYIEKLITLSKEDSLSNRRALKARLGYKNTVDKLLEVVGPTFKDRPGGYLRLTKMPLRVGDSAKMVVVEFVEEVSKPKSKPKKSKETTEKVEPQIEEQAGTKSIKKKTKEIVRKTKPATKTKNEKTSEKK